MMKEMCFYAVFLFVYLIVLRHANSFFYGFVYMRRSLMNAFVCFIPWLSFQCYLNYSKTCLNRPPTQKEDQKLVFKRDYRLIQVKRIAECSPWNILQCFRPSLSYHLSLRFLFCLFLSGRLRQVLLYTKLSFHH